ncbi:MAG: AAA family ATPase [Polyangiales bacterium]|nr:AAA family ATPase [Myxococcales bacterium]MCB9660564.1 AAA family ATPase [Sandaracinaceae bacterium]
MIQSKPMFIVLEGLDGSGKSTCAAGMASALGATLLTTPSPEVRRYRDDLVRSLQPSQEAAQLFYLATVFAASKSITDVLASGRSVVLDRYFLSTQAYAAFRGSRLDVDDLQAALCPADVTLYVDVSLETRLARLRARGATEADLETITPDADHRLREEHMRRAHLPVVGRFVRLDGQAGDAAHVRANALRAVGEMSR